ISGFASWPYYAHGRDVTGRDIDEHLRMGNDRRGDMALRRPRARSLLRRDHRGAHSGGWVCVDLGLSAPHPRRTVSQPARNHRSAVANPRIEHRPTRNVRVRGSPGTRPANASTTLSGRYARRAVRLWSSVRVPPVATEGVRVTRMGVMPNGIGDMMRNTLRMLEA